MSTRARCDADSVHMPSAGLRQPQEIIWTFWHEKKPPLRLQQMIESWKVRAPEWQVCQVYLWDNVEEVRHFGDRDASTSSRDVSPGPDSTFWFGTQEGREVLLHDIRRLGASALEPPLESSNSSGLAFATLKGPIVEDAMGGPGQDEDYKYKMTFDFRGKRDATAFYVRRRRTSMEDKENWEWRYHPDPKSEDSYLAFQLAYETELPSAQKRLAPDQMLERLLDEGSLPQGFFPPRQFYGQAECEFWPELENELKKTYGENAKISFQRVEPTDVTPGSPAWLSRVCELVQATPRPPYVPETYPHKSDLLRVLFLYKFGGLWLDASTVLVQQDSGRF